MKKSIYIFLFIATFGFYGCKHNGHVYLPVEISTSSHLKLVNYPTYTSNYILGAGDHLNEVDFVLRDCFTNEYISCSDSAGNIKDYIILFLGEGNKDWFNGVNDLFKEDGDEYYVKIYLAQHKKIDYKEQESKPLSYLDTIEVDIDDYVGLKHVITFNDTDCSVRYKGRKIPSYRLLSFKPRK